MMLKLASESRIMKVSTASMDADFVLSWSGRIIETSNLSYE
jgi:hypothetical protein